MNLNEINQYAQENNKVANFFKYLYNHCIKLLTSIPDETMKTILSRNKSGVNGCGDNYETAIVNGLIFQNVMGDDEEKDERCIDKIYFSTEVWYVDKDPYLDTEYTLKIPSSFDFRYLSMKLLLNRQVVIFNQETFGIENMKKEDRDFLKALKNPKYLEAVFGENLISSKDSVFTVSKNFFV